MVKVLEEEVGIPMGIPPGIPEVPAGAPGGVGIPEGGNPLGNPELKGWDPLIVVEPVELLGRIMLLTG